MEYKLFLPIVFLALMTELSGLVKKYYCCGKISEMMEDKKTKNNVIQKMKIVNLKCVKDVH